MDAETYKAMRLADVAANRPGISAAALAAAAAFLAPIAATPEGEDDIAILQGALAAADAASRLDAVTAERDRRIDGGISFNGTRYQTRAEDRENIAGAAQLAFMAQVAGQPFSLNWIAEDNTVAAMDAAAVIAFGQAVAQHKSAHIFAARVLKDRIASGEIITDVSDPSYWP